MYNIVLWKLVKLLTFIVLLITLGLTDNVMIRLLVFTNLTTLSVMDVKQHCMAATDVVVAINYAILISF
uniref:G_PROTEIN_RECEP_F1_2 domain-containing protein n=1 Tax=Elaeophora elaphi TaxID=1147741 RepID=A0A0R3RIJ0_9BILA